MHEAIFKYRALLFRVTSALIALLAGGSLAYADQPYRYAQRSGSANSSISALDLSAVKRALDLIRRGRPDEATSLARTSGQAVSTLVEWAVLRSGRNEGKPFERYASFLRTNAHWPSTGLFRTRAEEALWDEEISAEIVRNFFAESKPATPKGRFALARAHLAGDERDAAQRLVVHAWREDRFNQVVETRVLQEFGELLSGNDHKVRVSMRLYDKDNDAAVAAAKLLDSADVGLANAWIAVNTKAANARTLLNALPPETRIRQRAIAATGRKGSAGGKAAS